MIYVAKLLYYWLLPPGLFVLAALISALLYLRFKRKWLLFFAPCLIFMLSIRPVSNALVTPLEQAYQPPQLAMLKGAQAIVVLGGGSVGGVPDVDGTGQIPGGASVRLLTGFRLHRSLGLPIILSGGTVFVYTGTEADIACRTLSACGMDEQYLIKESKSRNTVENAKFTHAICRNKGIVKVVLVTSGYHMPRSVAIFKREGMEVIPYPTDYKVSKNTPLDMFAFIPNAAELLTSSLAIKEYLGLAAIKFGAQ